MKNFYYCGGAALLLAGAAACSARESSDDAVRVHVRQAGAEELLYGGDCDIWNPECIPGGGGSSGGSSSGGSSGGGGGGSGYGPFSWESWYATDGDARDDFYRRCSYIGQCAHIKDHHDYYCSCDGAPNDNSPAVSLFDLQAWNGTGASGSNGGLGGSGGGPEQSSGDSADLMAPQDWCNWNVSSTRPFSLDFPGGPAPGTTAADNLGHGFVANQGQWFSTTPIPVPGDSEYGSNVPLYAGLIVPLAMTTEGVIGAQLVEAGAAAAGLVSTPVLVTCAVGAVVGWCAWQMVVNDVAVTDLPEHAWRTFTGQECAAKVMLASAAKLIAKVGHNTVLSCDEAAKVANHLGYVWQRTNGSHQQWTKPGEEIFTLDCHGNKVDFNSMQALKKILRRLGLI